MDFYDRLLLEKKKRGLNNNDVGAIIGKSGDALRVAMKRKSLTDLEIKEIQRVYELGDLSETEPLDNRGGEKKDTGSMEDLLANRVFSKLKPFIASLQNNQKILIQNNSEILRQFALLTLDVDELMDKVEESIDELKEEIKELKNKLASKQD